MFNLQAIFKKIIRVDVNIPKLTSTKLIYFNHSTVSSRFLIN